LIAQPERKWLNFNHRRPPPPLTLTIAAQHALYTKIMKRAHVSAAAAVLHARNYFFASHCM
jgi:hypothetical protein